MPEQSGRGQAGAVRHTDRFDGESARRILQRAAAEQQRLVRDLDDSYSVEELEEIAAEAGISPDALEAAVETEKRGRRTPLFGTAPAPAGQPRHRRSEVRGFLPGRWFRTRTAIVLTTVGAAAFLASLLVFPAFAEAVFRVFLLLLIAVAVLILLGASPF